ncbi:MAG TPA: hypothetical protein VLT84_07190 [Acidobacteriota bacterium]|nr:hypothetical protein [Acidobacteriota bacterium]
MNEPPAEPPRLDEQRIARLITMAISAAVVVADVWLLVTFVRVASGLPGGWQRYWYIPAGIAGVFVFALARFLRHLKAYRRGE